VLFNVTGGPNMTLFEVNQAAAIIRETAHPDVNMIFGAVIDPNMGDEIRITVIATGFERASMPRRMMERPVNTSPRQQQEQPRPVQTMAPVERERPSETVSVTPAPPTPSINVNPPEFKAQPSYQEDLDIPTFLRNRR
jgi:cell division protein FtsZ